MRILVTGASGFVGAAVVRQAARCGHQVAVLKRPSSNLARISELLDAIEVVAPEDERPAELYARVAAFKPEAVVHAGWQGVDGSARQTLDQALVNVPMSVSVSEAARRCGSRVFLGFGSQAEYGPQSGQLDESAFPAPTTLYGAAKLTSARSISAILAGTSTRFAWLRLFSSYGPGDNSWWLLPYVVRSLLERKRPSMTAGEQQWDFLYIEDVARAALAVLETETATGFFNLGSGVAVALRTVIETVRDLIDPRLEIGFGEQPYVEGQVMHLHANISRLCNATDWRPTTPLAKGLANLVDAERSLLSAKRIG